MEQFQSSPQQPTQIPLFIENLPQGDEELSAQNLQDLDAALGAKLDTYLQPDNTIAGLQYFKLYRYAETFGVSDAVLKKYLKTRGVAIDSKNTPEERPSTIRYH